MSYTKVPHQKVRTGCKTCKQRRIKCDESKPACANCVKVSSACSYTLTRNLQEALSLETGLDLTDNPPPFSYADLELMHHWTATTANTMGPYEPYKSVMRDTIPLMAMNHSYLMHVILAMSALHIAYLRPAGKETYQLLAARHQALALPVIRSGLTNLNEENCHALFTCSHILVKCAFASPHPPGSLIFSPGRGDVAELVPLLRGASSIFEYARGWLTAGPFGHCLPPPMDEDPNYSQNHEDERYASLLPLFAKGGEDAVVCREALNSLRRLLAINAAPNRTTLTRWLVFSWPVLVSQRYIDLMSERNPEALVVLAHFCVMLNMLNSLWFMEGCAVRILDQCRRDLDDEWLPYIQWPLSVLGLGC